MNDIKIPALERPNGKLYRPRKIQVVTLGNEDELTGVVVFGTHDVRYAKLIAIHDVRDISAKLYDSSTSLEVSGSGQHVWLRRDLKGFRDEQPCYFFEDDPVTGRAGVQFEIEQIDVTG